MHEQSLMTDLINKINKVGKENQTKKIVGVKVRLGALSHISAEHFKEHFVVAAKGGLAENAILDIEVLTDINDSHAQEIMLDSVKIEE